MSAEFYCPPSPQGDLWQGPTLQGQLERSIPIPNVCTSDTEGVWELAEQPCGIQLNDSAVHTARLTWLCRTPDPPNGGTRCCKATVVNPVPSALLAVNTDSWTCQPVTAARAIPGRQLVWGTGQCPDGPGFWGTALREQNWAHPSHISSEGGALSAPYCPHLVTCHPWQPHCWWCHPITQESWQSSLFPTNGTACHLSSTAHPRSCSLCCLPLLPSVSPSSLQPPICPKPKHQITSLSTLCPSSRRLPHAFFFHPTVRSYYLTSLSRCLRAFFFHAILPYCIPVSSSPTMPVWILCSTTSSTAVFILQSWYPLFTALWWLTVLPCKKCFWSGNLKIIASRLNVAANLWHK